MNTSDYLRTVVDQTNRFADWVHDRKADTPVPTCPKWTLVDLVEHVGATQRMVAMLVGERLTEPDSAYARQVSGPTDPAQWRDWLVDCAARAREAFDSVDDNTPVWDPSGAGAGVPFWSRRLFGEVCVHSADAAVAVGAPYELEPERAVGAIEDWLDTMTSQGYWENRPGFADGMRGDGQTLHFHAIDAPGEWLARREPNRVALERTHADADVTVSGPAVDLMLVITRRLPLNDARLMVEGDRALFDRWIDHMDWVTD